MTQRIKVLFITLFIIFLSVGVLLLFGEPTEFTVFKFIVGKLVAGLFIFIAIRIFKLLKKELTW